MWTLVYTGINHVMLHCKLTITGPGYRTICVGPEISQYTSRRDAGVEGVEGVHRSYSLYIA